MREGVGGAEARGGREGVGGAEARGIKTMMN